MKARKEIRLSEEDLKVIEEKAKTAGLSVSEYIRKSALQGYVVVKNVEQYNNLYYEINKIGTNINQAVKLANVVQSVDKNDVIKLEKYLKEVLQLFKKVVNK